ARAFAEHDLAERHLHVGRGIRRRKDLARGGKGPRGDGGKGRVGIGADVHVVSSVQSLLVVVIASAAKQSISRHNGWMDCFVASLLAMTFVVSSWIISCSLRAL